MTTLHLPIMGASGHGASGSGIEAAASPRGLFILAWLSAPWQVRRNCRESSRLRAAAQAHAEELRRREVEHHEPHGYDLHRGLDGRLPNGRVRLHGYALPAIWPDDINYIESVAIHHRGPAAALAMLVASPAHVDHVTGRVGFFAEQTVYGVGYAPPAWYCLVTCPPEGGP